MTYWSVTLDKLADIYGRTFTFEFLLNLSLSSLPSEYYYPKINIFISLKYGEVIRTRHTPRLLNFPCVSKSQTMK